MIVERLLRGAGSTQEQIIAASHEQELEWPRRMCARALDQFFADACDWIGRGCLAHAFLLAAAWRSVTTDAGKLEIDVPRDPQSSSNPS